MMSDRPAPRPCCVSARLVDFRAPEVEIGRRAEKFRNSNFRPWDYPGSRGANRPVDARRSWAPRRESVSGALSELYVRRVRGIVSTLRPLPWRRPLDPCDVVELGLHTLAAEVLHREQQADATR